MKPVSSMFMRYRLLTLRSVDKTLVCDHSNKSYCTVLSCGIVSNALQGCGCG